MKLSIGSLAIVSLVFTAPAMADGPYLEGQLGYSFIQDVDTNQYSSSGSYGAYSISGSLNGSIAYDNAFTYGVELGYDRLVNSPIRVGISHSRLKAKLSSATVNGSFSVSGPGVSISDSGSLTYNRSALGGAAGAFDNDVSFTALNAYYDFNKGGAFTPFLGIGLGLADIENAKDTEWGYALHAGVQYALNQNVYLGLKGTYTSINGPTDKLGIPYQDVKVTTLLATVGYKF